MSKAPTKTGTSSAKTTATASNKTTGAGSSKTTATASKKTAGGGGASKTTAAASKKTAAASKKTAAAASKKTAAKKTTEKFTVWAFGQKKQLDIDTTLETNATLNAALSFPQPKSGVHAIVLHCTAGNSPAENTVNNTWNPKYQRRVEQKKKRDEWKKALAEWKKKHDEWLKKKKPKSEEPKKPVEPKKPEALASANYVLERCPATVSSADDPFPILHRLVPDSRYTAHTDSNAGTIGIEIVNAANEWKLASKRVEPTLPGKALPPLDENAFIAPTKANAKAVAPAFIGSKWQAFQDLQYEQLILFLRHLCVTHGIPRQFVGKTVKEMFTKAADKKLAKAVHNFQGIFHHKNVATKPCPGILQRNRIYRGITEEWWMPCEMDGAARTYYSGPFQQPKFVSAKDMKKGYFLWKGTVKKSGQFEPDVEAATYKDADVSALCEYNSYFDRNNKETYYGYCEKPGGTYPVGNNRLWHGGVHLRPNPKNATVYAAASGTIVAARLVCHEDTEKNNDYGSQRFVLIQHAVHELDAKGTVDYKSDPKIIFSLYMHLEKFADLKKEDDRNPPWFNIWLRNAKEDEKKDIEKSSGDGRGSVFFPNVEVSVGDILGIAGKYGKDPNCLHFEIFRPIQGAKNKEEAQKKAALKIDNKTTKPNKEFYADPSDKDGYCDDKTLDGILKDRMNTELAKADPVIAARILRDAATYHLSEWAIAETAFDKQYESIIKKHPFKKKTILKQKEQQWAHINRFLWWQDACKNQALAKQLGKEGFAYFYHPVTFMQCVNENAALEYTANITLASGAKTAAAKKDAAKKIPLTVSFNRISQHGGLAQDTLKDATLEYTAWINGTKVSSVSKKHSVMGTPVALDKSWTKKVVIPEDGKLEVKVLSFILKGKGLRESYDAAEATLNKNSSTPWGTGQESVVVESDRNLFSAIFTVKKMESK